MPVKAFEVIVSRDGQMSEQVAIASASKYLSYADASDTYGYLGDIIDINVYGGHSDGSGLSDTGPLNSVGRDYGIGLVFAVVITSEQEMDRFTRQLEDLAYVESFEQIHYEPSMEVGE